MLCKVPSKQPNTWSNLDLAFRECLQAMGATETLFVAVNRELDKHGYLVRCGQIIDASIVKTSGQHKRKVEK